MIKIKLTLIVFLLFQTTIQAQFILETPSILKTEQNVKIVTDGVILPGGQGRLTVVASNKLDNSPRAISGLFLNNSAAGFMTSFSTALEGGTYPFTTSKTLGKLYYGVRGIGYGTCALPRNAWELIFGVNMDYSVGVYGLAQNAGWAAGIYGEVGDENCRGLKFRLAGFFNGNVLTTGNSFSLSDAKVKTNVENLAGSGVLSKVLSLRPVKYQFRKDDYSTLQLPEGTNYGLIAQELSEVFPDLVSDQVMPPKYDKEGNLLSEAIAIKAVNYTALIPLLIASIKEQNGVTEQYQQTIQRLQSKIDEIEKKVIKPSDMGMMIDDKSIDNLKISPNPFSDYTTIQYDAKDALTSSQIIIRDNTGSVIQDINITDQKKGEIILNTSKWSSQIYFISLVLDNKVKSTQKIILQR